jgi:hypothetical protein
LANPARCIARNSQSPLRSPVNTPPVRFAPWAAGAETQHDDPRGRVAEPGIGRPQYVLVAVRGPLLGRDLLAPRDQPRARPAPTTSRSSASEQLLRPIGMTPHRDRQ